ncbi:MAG: F0F1 ATP synthase subunit delta [Wenzhouxiangella sp.]|nr:MAG: F0F1 ATP synthase subunit delta [Wenzhouxiangella sp.]
MLNRTTLARPYARAAFLSAREHDALERWSANLELAAQISAHDPVPELLDNPRLTRDQVMSLFTGTGGERFEQPFVNFLKTLGQYRRLALLPEICAQFEALRREAEKRVRALVTSAYPMDEEQTGEMRARLQARFGREIDLVVEVDASLIGGAVIRIEDQVMDGSVRGQLERLARQVAA